MQTFVSTFGLRDRYCTELCKNSFKNLRELQLLDCVALLDGPAYGFPQELFRLSLSGCASLRFIPSLVCNCKALTSLCIDRTLVKDTDIVSIARTCPKLHHCSVSSCSLLTNDGIAALLYNLPGLRHLVANNLSSLSDFMFHDNHELDAIKDVCGKT